MVVDWNGTLFEMIGDSVIMRRIMVAILQRPTWIMNVHGVGYRFIGAAIADAEVERARVLEAATEGCNPTIRSLSKIALQRGSTKAEPFPRAAPCAARNVGA